MSNYFRIHKDRLEGMGGVIREKLDETEKYGPQTMIDKVDGMELGGVELPKAEELQFGVSVSDYGITARTGEGPANAFSESTWRGWAFVCNASFTVTGFRQHNWYGTGIDYLALWDDMGNRLAYIETDGDYDSYTWSNVLLPNPVQLQKGQKYYVLAYTRKPVYTYINKVKINPLVSFAGNAMFNSSENRPYIPENYAYFCLVDFIIGEIIEGRAETLNISTSTLDEIAVEIIRIKSLTSGVSTSEIRDYLKSIS